MSGAASCAASAPCRASMKMLSSGDLESEIYRSGQSDEIAEMSEFAAGVPREHDRGTRVDRRPGQGPHRQGRTRLAHGKPHRRIRDHGAQRAGQPLGRRQFDADHGAEHVGDRRSVERAGQRGGLRRRRDLGQRADRVVRHRAIVVLDRRDRPPGRHLGRDRPQGGRRKPAPPTPPCRALPTMPRASASWST